MLFPDQEVVFCDPSIEVFSYNNPTATKNNNAHSQPQKPWTFLVYIAADNDLRFFATNNIKQMTEIGSTEYVNILVHLDIRITGNQKVTRRYYIQKGKLIHVNGNDPATGNMDSGDPATLISSVDWATKYYPSEHLALILWNHGTGIIDPRVRKTFNPSDLFIYNSTRNKLELDRSIGILDLLNSQREIRGICWDNTTGNFLTNEKIVTALNHSVNVCLKGKKISLIGFDACLMSMVEVASMIKPFARVMVGSEEAELGWGWNYASVLTPFLTQTLTPREFGTHIVRSYENAYRSVTDDYTQSAIDLERLETIEDNIHHVADLLLNALEKQQGNTLFHAIKTSRSKFNCTHFDEPRYIDLHHFYVNLSQQVQQLTFSPEYGHFKTDIHNALAHGRGLIETLAFANTCGTNLSNAKGLAIYFPDSPDRAIDVSYTRTNFAQKNSWSKFLNKYLVLRTTMG